MAIEVKKIGGWGDLVRISNGIIDIDVSTAFGGHRLWQSSEVMTRTYLPCNEPNGKFKM